MLNRVKEGYFLGKAPIGYKNAQDSNGHGIIVPDETNSFYIKRAFELYSTGQYSYKAVGLTLFKQGFMSKKGEPFPSRKIEWLLKNPVYIGKVTWKNQIFDNGKHTPLVSRDLFYRVQSMFKEMRKSQSIKEELAYSNYIKCRECGYMFTGEVKHGGHKSGKYIYYHCVNYKGFHKTQKNISQKMIDDAIMEVLSSFEICSSDIEKVRQKVEANILALKDYNKQSLKELQAQQKKLHNTISNSLKQKMNGELDMDDNLFNKLQREWQEENDRLTIRISELKASTKDRIKKSDKLVEFAHRMPEMFEKATPQEKRIIIGAITDSIEYANGVLYVKLKPIYEHLRQTKLEMQKNFEQKNIVDRTRETVDTNGNSGFIKNQNPIRVTTLDRTLKSPVNTKKEPHLETQILNGAGGGIVLLGGVKRQFHF